MNTTDWISRTQLQGVVITGKITDFANDATLKFDLIYL